MPSIRFPVYLESTLTEVKDHAVVIKDKEGKTVEIPCDSVISAVGYRPAPLKEAGGKVYLIGDCRKVGNIMTAVWEAYETAMKI